MFGGDWPLLPEILGEPAPVGAKSPIFNRVLITTESVLKVMAVS